MRPTNQRRLAKRAGIDKGITDAFEGGRLEAVQDIVALCRGRPQFTVPVIDAALEIPRIAHLFEHLARDRMFGTAGPKKTTSEWKRPEEPTYVQKVANFFWETREQEGEFCFFLRYDMKAVTLRAGQRFNNTRPYEECF